MLMTVENDFFKRIGAVLDRPYHSGLYVELYEVLHLVCEQFAEGRLCSDFFSLLGVVCDTCEIPLDMAVRLCCLLNLLRDYMGVNCRPRLLVSTWGRLSVSLALSP